MNKIRKRLTYANVMSTIAVFLMLGGATALAADQLGKNTVGPKQLKKNAVTGAKIKASAVGAAKIGGGAITTDKIANDAVTGAKVNESSLGQVPSANTANSAAIATSANPEAFAKIEGDGTVVDALSKGVTSANVTHPSAGTYCVTVPAFAPRGGQATPQFGGSYGFTTNVSVGGTGFCPAPAVQVLTISGGAAPAPSNDTFYVELYH